MTDLRPLAYHRAGHAVVALHLGVTCPGASLRADDDAFAGLGIPDWVRPNDELDERTRIWVDQHVQVTWAGLLAEVEFCDVPVAEANAAAGDDLARLDDLAAFVTGGSEELDAYLEWLRCRTLNVLRHHWIAPQVRTVADALLTRSPLSGRQVRALARTGHPAYAQAHAEGHTLTVVPDPEE